jgi:hypothetical protein
MDNDAGLLRATRVFCVAVRTSFGGRFVFFKKGAAWAAAVPAMLDKASLPAYCQAT